MPPKRDLPSYYRQSSTPASQNSPQSQRDPISPNTTPQQDSGTLTPVTSEQASNSGIVHESPPPVRRPRKSGTPRRKFALENFALDEAEASDQDEEFEEENLEEEPDEDSADDDEGEESRDPEGFHQRVDLMHQDSGTDFVVPYFPAALAVSSECPMRFNFDLRLLDDLRLPCQLVARTEVSMVPSGEDDQPRQPVTFKTSEEAISYCEERLREGWLVGSDAGDERSRKKRLSHPELKKEQLFQQEGKNLDNLLASGIPELDLALDKVRLDRFGNVMIWAAPGWSDASVQFTHGFPRRLIQAEHGGFLPGNVIVTAKASNLAIRRMAVFDVASLISSLSIGGVGLNVGRLLNLRYAAVRYHRYESYLPDYLVRGMLEFGVSFLTFQAVESETLEALADAVKNRWAGEEEESDDEFVASASLPSALLAGMGHRVATEGERATAGEERNRALARILSNSVAEQVGSRATEQDTTPRSSQQQETGAQVSSRAKRRRVKGSSSASSGPPSKKSKTPETVEDSGSSTSEGEGGADQSATTAAARGRYQLDACPVRGLRRDVFPEGEAKTKLHQFFERHQPLDPKVVETNAGGATIWSSPRDMLSDAGIRDGQREREVQGLLRALFDKLRSQCVCEDGSCAIRSGTPSMSGDPAPACQTQRCQICRVFEAQPRELYRRSLPLRNERLNQLLCCCPAIAQLCRLAKPSATLSPAESARHDQEVRELLCGLVQCRDNRLNCMRNVGDLAELAPRLLCVQLEGGHAEFWSQLRTVAKAVNKQPNLDAKLAALLTIRKAISPGNHWAFYLAVDEKHSQKEMEILQGWTAALSAARSPAAPASSTSQPAVQPRSG